MAERPSASIVIPSLQAGEYLDVALDSIMPQARATNAEVIVVSDGPDPTAEAIAARHGARQVALPETRGVNAARNLGIDASRSDLIVFTDQDVDAPSGWLDAFLAGAASAPERAVFGGPIRARLEGGGPRSCGRESAPITTLDFGPKDRDVPHVWGTNMAIRRRAFQQVGKFDGTLSGRGDEDEWELRWKEAGGRIRYLAAAGIDHRRTADDARLRALVRVAYRHGREARRHDARRGSAPPGRRELRTLVGCAWHVVRRRCANGVVMVAHSAGRVREALAPTGDPVPTGMSGHARPSTSIAEPDDFLSGSSGEVSGIRAKSRALASDIYADALDGARLRPLRLRRAASAWPRRQVLAIGIERTGTPNLLDAAGEEMLRSQHAVTFARRDAADRGRFENLNALLAENSADGYDWLLVVDDDVSLPHGFLDAFVFLAERFQLRLAQPAHRNSSHAAWRVTRRQTATVVRETAFVEIGPVVAFHHVTFEVILPFPPLRVGWGLDLHWSALAREHGWRVGIVDATPVQHALRPVASSYDRRDALAEARRFLADRPYTRATEAETTLARHRKWK